MVPVKLAATEEELIEELNKYYDEETVKGMIASVKRNGMSAWGAFMVREALMALDENRKYNLFRLPGHMPQKRSENNA